MTILTTIHEAFVRWMALPSLEAVDVVAAAVVAARLPGKSVFLVLVGPSGSGKSELIESIEGVRDVVPLGRLTPAAFLSGYKDSEQSLLHRLPKDRASILTMKDLTTLAAAHPYDRSQIMAQLREIYDGKFALDSGVGRKTWSGKVSLLAACTAIYDELARSMSALGERFVVYRPYNGDDLVISQRAMRTADEDQQMKADLRASMARLDSITVPSKVPVTQAEMTHLGHLCRFLAVLRTPVARDQACQICQMPVPESSGRLAKQLIQLYRGLLVVRERTQRDPSVSADVEEMLVDLGVIERVVWSSAPSLRVKLLTSMPMAGASVRELAALLRVSRSVVGRTLEDLGVLGILHKGPHADDSYRPSSEWTDAIQGLREAERPLDDTPP